MTREQLIEAIAGITAQLKRHMPDIERALFVADRKDFRERLAELDAKDHAP